MCAGRDGDLLSCCARNLTVRTCFNLTFQSYIDSTPDHFGIINDIEFQVVYSTYLGQPCPLMAPVVGHFFGKDGAQLDRYGANLGSAILPGQGHRRGHNILQSIVQSMMKLAGVASEKEALNFLLGKVGEPYITRYINHVSSVPNSRKAPHAIVPDIHAFNWPTGSQRFNDSGVSSAAEAFFEVKTFSGCKSRYKQNNSTIKPADRRAREVTREYPRKFKKLDELFAAEVVGDGTGDAVGPFEAAQGQFYRGQVIPLCAGWFGEVNKDFEKVLRLLARHAAAGDDGITISPLVNTDRKGGAYPIMLQQFRRAIGVAIVRGNAKLKLSRMHYVRETAQEAAAVYNAHHSKNGRWRPGRNGSGSWFSSHIPEGYGAFEQFRNGYDFCMH